MVKKVTSSGGAVSAQVINRSDYYPFGMPLPNREITDASYRYKFQGQEKDTETGMEAFELRLWDGRLGRWQSPDPYRQYASPYMGMGNNPVSRTDPDGGIDGCDGCPDNAKPGDVFNHPDYGELTYSNGGWVDSMGGGLLDAVVINKTNDSLRMNMALTLTATSNIEAFLIADDAFVIGFADDVLIPVVAVAGATTFAYFASQLPHVDTRPTYSNALKTGINTTAGPNAYKPEYNPEKYNVQTILTAQALTTEMVHQMGKGGKQGQWDDEISPLSDDELLSLLQQATAAGNTALKLRIQKEQKRRGSRNKGKDRGRGDVK